MIRLNMLGTVTLRGADGRELRSVLTQPKRLALLGYLAVEAAHGFQRRDRLFALFWPELSQAQARQSLRQSLYVLRRAMGEPVVVNRGAEEIGIAPDSLWCDVGAFTDLLARKRYEDALSLYRGDFLGGFFIADASAEFEHWLDATRERLRQRAADAAWTLAGENEHGGRATQAAQWARYATGLAPDDERSLQRLVALLDRQGDRAGALRAYAEFAERLQREFEVEPSAETRAMVEAVRSRACVSAPPAPVPEDGEAAGDASGHAADTPGRVADAPGVVADAPGGTGDPPGDAPGAAASAPVAVDGAANRARMRGKAYLAAAIIVAVGVAAILTARIPRAHTPPPVVAVGWIQDPSGADTASSVRTLAELMATDLARVPGLHVVSHARLYDMLGQLGAHEETPSAISEAARRAGVNELIEGVLDHAPGRGLRLDLRRVDLATGTADGRVHTFAASTVFELADRATAQVAADFDLRAPAEPLTDVTTTSVAAERLYDEGLRQFYQSDVQTAVELFHAALNEDSTFAMAAYYAGLGEEATEGPAARRDLALALRLADRVPERERLIIRQTWAYTTNNPAQFALAESLVTRYPDEPGGELALGRAMSWSGNFLGALPHLRRALHMDSLSLTGRGPWCRACEALDAILATYLSADSLDAAERVSRERTRMQPRSAGAWWALADVFARQARYDSALAAEQVAERMGGSGFDYVIPRAVIAIRAGDFAAADRLLTDQALTGDPAKRGNALWWLVISLRNQGRLRDALAAAERMVRTTAGELPSFNTPRSLDAVAVAQVMFEMGRDRAAAALFDSIANYDWRSPPTFRQDAPGLIARHRIWMTTHVATALAAAGDTAPLVAIGDSLAVWGPRSAYFRDRVLHHYVRGLLLVARGQTTDAEREFRGALLTPMEGYSRINFELGKVLLAEGRPREAIPVFRAPLRGTIEASNYYLTNTELHAMLGSAFDRAGEPDSALVHYERALAAWRNADAEFRPRVDSIERRVRTLRMRGRDIIAPAAPRTATAGVATTTQKMRAVPTPALRARRESPGRPW